MSAAERGSQWKGQAAREPGVSVRNGVTVIRPPTFGILWSQPVTPMYLSAARWKSDVVYVHRPHPLAPATKYLSTEDAIVLVIGDADKVAAGVASLEFGELTRLDPDGEPIL